MSFFDAVVCLCHSFYSCVKKPRLYTRAYVDAMNWSVVQGAYAVSSWLEAYSNFLKILLLKCKCCIHYSFFVIFLKFDGVNGSLYSVEVFKELVWHGFLLLHHNSC